MVKKRKLKGFGVKRMVPGSVRIRIKKVKRMVWGHAEGAKGGLEVKRERVGLQIHTYSFRV